MKYTLLHLFGFERTHGGFQVRRALSQAFTIKQARVLQICVVLVSMLSAYASEIKLLGTVETKYFKPSGDLNFSKVQKFEMRASGDNYLIRLETPGEDMRTDYAEVAFDGTNSYYIDVMVGWTERERAKGVKVGTNVATAFLTGIPVPQFSFAGPSSILWCAYVAPAFLSNKTTGTVLYTPFTEGSQEGGKHANPGDFVRRKAEWKFDEESSNALDQLVFLDQVVKDSGNKSASVEPRFFTNSVFKTLEWTNTVGQRIPKRATAAIFASTDKGIWKVTEYALTLLEALEHSGQMERQLFRPVIPGYTLITEERFNNPEKELHFTYFVRSNWPSRDQAKSTSSYVRAERVAENRVSNTKPSGLTFLAFAVLFLAPILLVWRHRRKKVH